MKQKALYERSFAYPVPAVYCFFYNGTKQESERQELKLSDLFVKNGEKKVPPGARM